MIAQRLYVDHLSSGGRGGGGEGVGDGGAMEMCDGGVSLWVP